MCLVSTVTKVSLRWSLLDMFDIHCYKGIAPLELGVCFDICCRWQFKMVRLQRYRSAESFCWTDIYVFKIISPREPFFFKHQRCESSVACNPPRKVVQPSWVELGENLKFLQLQRCYSAGAWCMCLVSTVTKVSLRWNLLDMFDIHCYKGIAPLELFVGLIFIFSKLSLLESLFSSSTRGAKAL